MNGLHPIVALLLVLLALSPVVQPQADPVPGKPFHLPIAINGDGDFTPGNGVVGGNGSSEDPFRIEGWQIWSVGTGILIQNTSKHVLIGGNDLFGPGVGEPFSAAIRMSGVANVSVHANFIGANEVGIFCGQCRNLEISNNTIGAVPAIGFPAQAVHVMQSADVRIEGNLVEHTDWGILVADESSDVQIMRNTVRNIHMGQGIAVYMNVSRAIISNNVVEHAGVGIWAAGATLIRISENQVAHCNDGVYWDNWSGGSGHHFPTVGLWIEDNVVRSCETGISGIDSSDVHVTGNTVEESGTGVAINHATEVRYNSLVANERGIEMWSVAPVIFSQNSIVTTDGVAVEAWQDADLSQNWWGTSEGPDPSDIVLHNGATVVVEPWLSAPPAAP